MKNIINMSEDGSLSFTCSDIKSNSIVISVNPNTVLKINDTEKLTTEYYPQLYTVPASLYCANTVLTVALNDKTFNLHCITFTDDKDIFIYINGTDVYITHVADPAPALFTLSDSKIVPTYELDMTGKNFTSSSVDLTIPNGYTVLSWIGAKAYKIGNLVYIICGVKANTVTPAPFAVIAQLPTGYKPKKEHNLCGRYKNGPDVTVCISTNGDIKILDITNSTPAQGDTISFTCTYLIV